MRGCRRTREPRETKIPPGGLTGEESRTTLDVLGIVPTEKRGAHGDREAQQPTPGRRWARVRRTETDTIPGFAVGREGERRGERCVKVRPLLLSLIGCRGQPPLNDHFGKRAITGCDWPKNPDVDKWVVDQHLATATMGGNAKRPCGSSPKRKVSMSVEDERATADRVIKRRLIAKDFPFRSWGCIRGRRWGVDYGRVSFDSHRVSLACRPPWQVPRSTGCAWQQQLVWRLFGNLKWSG